jgi:hypothetical protein
MNEVHNPVLSERQSLRSLKKLNSIEKFGTRAEGGD